MTDLDQLLPRLRKSLCVLGVLTLLPLTSERRIQAPSKIVFQIFVPQNLNSK